MAFGGLDVDQTVAEQPFDGLVDAVALRDVDDLVLVSLLDQLLHAIRVHRRLGQHRQHRDRQHGSPRRHGLSIVL